MWGFALFSLGQLSAAVGHPSLLAPPDLCPMALGCEKVIYKYFVGGRVFVYHAAETRSAAVKGGTEIDKQKAMAAMRCLACKWWRRLGCL